MNRNVLPVDDEPDVVRSLKREVRGGGYTISSAHAWDTTLEQGM